MSAPLPEVAVADAPPETAAVYESIMRATGVGSPALIYRHFAVFPGFLAWVWGAVGEELESGHVADHALDAVARTETVALPPVGDADMAHAGVDDTGRRTVRAMLDTYNRMNPINLCLISAVRDLIADPDAPAAAPPALPAAPPAPPPDAPEELPPPVDLADMPEALRDAVVALSAAIPSPGAQVIPTLYRHLAIWPDLMLALTPDIQKVTDRGDVSARMADLQCEMQPLIADVTARARRRDVGAPPVDDAAAMLTTLNSFLFTIPHMVVIGTALDAALPPHPR